MLDTPKAIRLAVAQLSKPEMRRPLMASLLWTMATFALIWFGVGYALSIVLHGHPWAGWAVGILGALAVPVLTLLLFPMVATMMLGFYAESIILAVERHYYPDLASLPKTRWGDQIRSLLGLTAISIFLNLLSLPFYLLTPGANLVLFLGMNGYVLGRGYFELVALRRLDWRSMRRLWGRHRLDFALIGAALAAVFSVPIINLLAPVIGTAAAVHLFEEARRRPEIDRWAK